MGRLTFFEVLFIAFVVMLWNGNDSFMASAREHQIEWFIRYPVGLIMWAVTLGLAAIVWRVLFGKERWK